MDKMERVFMALLFLMWFVFAILMGSNILRLNANVFKFLIGISFAFCFGHMVFDKHPPRD